MSRDVIFKARRNWERRILVERDAVSGKVVAVSYDGLLLPFIDKFVITEEADKKEAEYEPHWDKTIDQGRIVKDRSDVYGNLIFGIVLAERPINER